MPEEFADPVSVDAGPITPAPEVAPEPKAVSKAVSPVFTGGLPVIQYVLPEPVPEAVAKAPRSKAARFGHTAGTVPQ